MELPMLEIDTMDEQSLGIKHALLDNNKGGRIMITTRNREVASFCKKFSHVHVFELQPLTPDEAWELFCKRVFQFEFGGHCPPILEKLSQDIVEK
ncbi:putative disease resistance RPP13-like protein 1 [Quercus lobata]|uniref:putative disease resistance RPP13-like protein 1 n=1 Tax=Quercus lobata TaxID=97700 RepID=UPI001248F539|nr:putative disease resistance RPP13-like protein 1 [Quercus lobata]